MIHLKLINLLCEVRVRIYFFHTDVQLTHIIYRKKIFLY